MGDAAKLVQYLGFILNFRRNAYRENSLASGNFKVSLYFFLSSYYLKLSYPRCRPPVRTRLRTRPTDFSLTSLRLVQVKTSKSVYAIIFQDILAQINSLHPLDTAEEEAASRKKQKTNRR